MRRPPIDCQRAAQSLATPPLQHIWISEDLLSYAFRQFFHRGCNQQRRHGSHVPGPLEARRRAAKRRMTAQAHISPPGGVPPGFSFGALFGVRSSPQPSWRYEPPSIPRPSEPLIQSFPVKSPIPDFYPSFHPPEPPEPATTDSVSPEVAASELALQRPNEEEQQEPPIVRRPTVAIASKTNQGESGPWACGAKVGPLVLDRRKRKKARIVQTVDRHKKASRVEGNSSTRTPNTLQASLQKFRFKIRTATQLPDSRRFDFLKRSIQTCCPTGKRGGDFTLLALRHLRRANVSSNTIIACLLASEAPLPNPRTPKGLEFVRQLSDMARTSPKVQWKLERLYSKLVDTVMTKRKNVREPSIRILYRAIWENAMRGQILRDQFEATTVQLLSRLGAQFANPQTRVYLRRISRDSSPTFDHFNLLAFNSSLRYHRRAVGEVVLDCVPRTLLCAWIESVPPKLFGEGEDRNDSEKHKHLGNWLRMLRDLQYRINTDSGNVDVYTSALRSLAAYDINPSAVAFYLMSLRPQVMVAALLNWVPYQKSLRDIPPRSVDDFLRLNRVFLRQDSRSRVPRNEILARFLARMRTHGLPNHEMANMIVSVVCRHSGLGAVREILKRLKWKGVGLSDTEFLYEFLGQFLKPSRGAPIVPSLRQDQGDAFTIRAIQSIRALRMESQNVERKLDRELVSLHSRRKFEHIIHSARADHVFPLKYTDLTLESLMENQVEFIHQIAYQYSLDRTRTSTENWRLIYYLYRYLQDNNLPIGDMFTRAVMRTCVIQPLSENRFVSARRLTWVCGLIAPIEGVDVARRTENIFWLWRGDIIKHAKRTLHANGGTGRAHVSTMKRLGLI